MFLTLNGRVGENPADEDGTAPPPASSIVSGGARTTAAPGAVAPQEGENVISAYEPSGGMPRDARHLNNHIIMSGSAWLSPGIYTEGWTQSKNPRERERTDRISLL